MPWASRKIRDDPADRSAHRAAGPFEADHVRAPLQQAGAADSPTTPAPTTATRTVTQTNALRPVIARPTISDCTESVPS